MIDCLNTYLINKTFFKGVLILKKAELDSDIKFCGQTQSFLRSYNPHLELITKFSGDSKKYNSFEVRFPFGGFVSNQ